MLLPIPVTAADPLFDALWVPRQVVIYDRVAKLKIEPFCARLSRDKNPRTCLEFMNQGKSNGNGTTWPLVRRKRRTYLILPSLQCLSSPRRVIDTPKECYALGIKASLLDQQFLQVGLRSQGFSKDHNALAAYWPGVN